MGAVFTHNSRLTSVARGLRERLAREDGFTMLAVTMAIIATSAMVTAAATSAQINVSQHQKDRWGKQALLAAEAGLADYTQQLAANSNYYALCDNATAPAGTVSAVNDRDVGSNTQASYTGLSTNNGKILRRWLPNPNYQDPAALAASTWQYTIDLDPAKANSTCKGSDPDGNMIDQTNGTFELSFTGRAGPPVPPSLVTKQAQEQYRQANWTRRTVVVDFRRRGFLDFAWLTDKETQDPILYSDPATAEQRCDMYFTSGRSNNTNYCGEIHFGNGDWIKGPFHTNDAILADSGSSFGRPGGDDRIEISSPTCPIRQSVDASNCTNAANIYGTLATGASAPQLPLPEANSDLETYGAPSNGGLTYTGMTTIVLNSNGTMTVTNANVNGGAAQTVNYPTDGVVYVKNGPGCNGYDPVDGWNPSGDATCGLIAIGGTYNKSLTFAAEDDVVITSNVLRAASTPDAVLGLVANKFVRVRHYNTNSNCQNVSTGTPAVTQIYAAIMALQHSFLLDWYNCGASLGTLHVYGVIVQNFRGYIGTFGNNQTGYIKDYNYDDKFKYRTPPYFLSPAFSGWRTVRYREARPACLCNEDSSLLAGT